MADYDFAKIEKKLSKYLDEDRFQHTMGVMYTSACLAMVHGYDVKDAQVAGLLHDCAKCIPNKKKLKMCSEHNIPVSDFELGHPFLLHARLGAYIAHEKYGIDNQEILSAINYHTTGRCDMSLLEKIIYIADYMSLCAIRQAVCLKSVKSHSRIWMSVCMRFLKIRWNIWKRIQLRISRQLPEKLIFIIKNYIINAAMLPIADSEMKVSAA
mgnify:CR=1 FL=1